LSLATSGKWELVSSVVSWELGVPFVPAEADLGIAGGVVGTLALLFALWVGQVVRSKQFLAASLELRAEGPLGLALGIPYRYVTR